jgi:methionyl-tRNA synthetase
MKNFYITTPIYYVNDAPHIGHSYTTVLADILTRFHKLIGYQTFFLTGTDEHGQKVQQAAAKRQVDPQTHVDEYNLRFKNLWNKMDINYDYFFEQQMQTTSNLSENAYKSFGIKVKFTPKNTKVGILSVKNAFLVKKNLSIARTPSVDALSNG